MHHTEMQRLHETQTALAPSVALVLTGTPDTPWQQQTGMLTFRRTTRNSDRAKINVSPVLIGFFFSGVNLR